MTAEGSKASPLWIWFCIIMFGVLGLLMLTHGLGLHDASWFNPNPEVPRWVFALIGILLLTAMPLLMNQVRPIPGTMVNLAGYSFLAGAWVAAHWMAFFAEGGSCSFEGITLALGLPDIICTGVLGAVLLLFDGFALLIAGRALLRRKVAGE